MEKSFDLKEIHRRLPYGSLTVIGDRLDISPRIVAEVLVRGWHKKLRNQVVEVAMDLLASEFPDQALLKKADGMDLSANQYTIPNKKRKKKIIDAPVSADGDDFSNKDLMVLGGVVAVIAALFYFFRNKEQNTGGIYASVK